MALMNIFRKLVSKSKRAQPDTAAPGPSQRINPGGLRELIIYCFDLPEMKELCFDLGFEKEQLPILLSAGP